MATQADLKTDSTPLWIVSEVGDAIFDELCPGIRFTPADDARYAAAARAALKACGFSRILTALEELTDAAQMEADSDNGISGQLAGALKDARAVLGWEE